MNIRRYTQNDLEAVVAVFRSNIPKYFTSEEEPGLRDYVRDFPDDYFVLELDGDVVGAGGIGLNNDIDPPTVSLCWGMVRADHLGTGLGRKLTEFRIGLSREKHPGAAITIDTSQHTEGFYHKLGFVTLDHKIDGYGPGIDKCEMRLDTSS